MPPREPSPSPFGRRPGRPRERDREPDRDTEEVWTGPIRTPRRGDADEPSAFGTGGGWPADPSLAPVVFRIASAFGCLRRLVMLVVILIVLAILAFFGLFGVGGLLYGDGAIEPRDQRGTAEVCIRVDVASHLAVDTKMQRFSSTCRLTVAAQARQSIA